VTSRTTIVSYNAAPVDSLFTQAGVTPCTCSFLTWGWWSGDVKNPGGRDRLNFATYVVGTQSLVADINAMTSTATYRGHLAGNVDANGKQYIQVGSYQNVWNFGARNGVATVNFDGMNFGGGSTANTFMTGA